MLLLDRFADEGLYLWAVETRGSRVDQFAIAHHDNLRVVALDLDNVLKQLTHLGKVGTVVLLHLEHARVVVQRDDAELVWLGESGALTLDLVRRRHDLGLAFVEDDMSRVRCVALRRLVELEQQPTGRGPEVPLAAMPLSHVLSFLLIKKLMLKALLLQAHETEVNEVPIIIEVARDIAWVEGLEALLSELQLLALDHGVLHLDDFGVCFLEIATDCLVLEGAHEDAILAGSENGVGHICEATKGSFNLLSLQLLLLLLLTSGGRLLDNRHLSLLQLLHWLGLRLIGFGRLLFLIEGFLNHVENIFLELIRLRHFGLIGFLFLVNFLKTKLDHVESSCIG